MNARRAVRDLLLTVLILATAFGVVLFLQRSYSAEVYNAQAIAPMLFVMAVFIVSLVTQGFVWGILAALLGVLAVNFAFAFPFFEINFSIPENLFSGVVMLFVAVMTSTLTTSIKKQERLRAESEREKMRANLLRAVSHDLRTPLTSIYGSCSTIIDNYDSLGKAQQLKLLGEVCADAEWLNRMVENLLSVTRIGSGEVSVVKTSTVLEELIDAVLVKFRKYAPGQSVEVDIPDAFVTIPMDSILIEQVLINLMENAVRHARGMTRLTLRVFLLGGRAIFEVTDDGCGIPRDRLATLFTGAVEQSRDDDGEKHGMGIGLSVCATIIRAHGGDIQAESRIDSGTTIRFLLETEEPAHDE